jgi:CheY-like chemotaxis protein
VGRRESIRPSAIAGPSRSDPPPSDPHQDVTGALHDVSNALTVLLGWVAEARDVRANPEQLDHALAVIEDRARTARNLARRAIGAQTPIDERDDLLDAVVGQVVDSLSVEAHRVGVRLEVVGRCGGGLRIALAADAAQVLTNVLLTALEWTPCGSRVLIEPADEGAWASIAVEDEGPGVPSEKADSIFAGASTRQEGAGVGLKYARAVARAAGGDLELVSGAVPSGARFRMRWPRLDPAVAVPPPSAPRSQVMAGTRILVVEDDADVATLLETALEARGAQVVIARTAGELADAARREHDVALVDLSPIAEDVRGAIAALRRGSPHLALVFITGSAVGLPEGLDLEGAIWVRKPFEIAEVIAALAETRSGQ